MAEFTQERTDINTRALIDRVQGEVRTINEGLKRLTNSFDHLNEEFGKIGKEISALLEHKQHVVTWFKLGLVAATVCGVCWRLTEDAKSTIRLELKTAQTEMALKLSKAEEATANAQRMLFEASQREKPKAAKR